MASVDFVLIGSLLSAALHGRCYDSGSEAFVQ